MTEIELTQEQKDIIISTWNSRKEDPPGLQELTQIVFPDIPNLDGRSKYGKVPRGKSKLGGSKCLYSVPQIVKFKR